MPTTKIKKLTIRKFRALNNVEVEFGDRITVICGKNGTSKSSILGIAAQIFSFEKDYLKDAPLDHRTITGAPFKSQYRDHLRISDKFDRPNSWDIEVEVFDGYTQSDATGELKLSKRQDKQQTKQQTIPRPILRNNSTVGKATKGENASRNFTHPVIFLGLKRLYPIANREDYKTEEYDYLAEHKDDFRNLTNKILNRKHVAVTGTSGTVLSAVSHGNNYDQDSVSAGEDNTGQLILALLSFKKLREDYPDYKGGLLLIDEADAGLFPGAQTELIEVLYKMAMDLNLQIVMTSHSPTLVETVYEKSQSLSRDFKTVYLTDSYGDIQAQHDVSWQQINADLHTETLKIDKHTSLPPINVYVEDQEARDLLKAILFGHGIYRIFKFVDVNIGESQYRDLLKRKVPEFSKKSIICLDGDVKSDTGKVILRLPGKIAPDKVIFEYLYNFSADHPIWRNSQGFTHAVFTKRAMDISQQLELHSNEEAIDLKAIIDKYQSDGDAKGNKLRKPFKDFYQNSDVQSFLKSEKVWIQWVKDHEIECSEFKRTFLMKAKTILEKEFHVDKSKLDFLVAKNPQKRKR